MRQSTYVHFAFFLLLIGFLQSMAGPAAKVMVCVGEPQQVATNEESLFEGWAFLQSVPVCETAVKSLNLNKYWGVSVNRAVSRVLSEVKIVKGADPGMLDVCPATTNESIGQLIANEICKAAAKATCASESNGIAIIQSYRDSHGSRLPPERIKFSIVVKSLIDVDERLVTNVTTESLSEGSKTPETNEISRSEPLVTHEKTSVDLGGGTKMAFAWIEAIKCWVGKYEVSNEEYHKCQPNHDSRAYFGKALNGASQPVVRVSYDGAVAYCEWMNRRGGLPDGFGAKLPDGDQWTGFAKCGDERIYPWGNNDVPEFGNYGDQSLMRIPG